MEHTTRVHILSSLGTIEVDKLTRGRLERWHENLASSPARLRSRAGAEQRFKPATQTEEEKRARKSSANRVLAILKAALNYSITQGNASTGVTKCAARSSRRVCGRAFERGLVCNTRPNLAGSDSVLVSAPLSFAERCVASTSAPRSRNRRVDLRVGYAISPFGFHR